MVIYSDLWCLPFYVVYPCSCKHYSQFTELGLEISFTYYMYTPLHGVSQISLTID